MLGIYRIDCIRNLNRILTRMTNMPKLESERDHQEKHFYKDIKISNEPSKFKIILVSVIRNFDLFVDLNSLISKSFIFWRETKYLIRAFGVLD